MMGDGEETVGLTCIGYLVDGGRDGWGWTGGVGERTEG